jgi:alkanesulfonate monooxygenase SsuD/methylene tetrahydromethanopterin reductase-like flavin-dependent oxidoreductase (luciferase family)
MNLWYYVNAQAGASTDDRRQLEHLRTEALRAEAAGFGAICLTEHHLTGYNYHSNPFTFGAHLAGVLEHAWIVVSVAVLPAHHPVRLAEDMNLLDQLTHGRCVVGIGGGASLLELQAFGIDSDAQRNAVSAATLKVLDQLLERVPTDEPLAFDTGVHEGVVPGRIVPAPYRATGAIRARPVNRSEAVVAAGASGWPVLFGRRAEPGAVATALAIHRGSLRRGKAGAIA